MARRMTGVRAVTVIVTATLAGACGNASTSSQRPGGIGAGDWPWRYDMVSQPSLAIASETQSPAEQAMSLRSEVPVPRQRADQQLRNPVPPGDPVDAGRTLYGVYCLPCHGIDLAGDGVVAPYFGSIPDLTSPDVQQHGDGWLYATITNGTDRMPRYISELTPEERWQIVHFLRLAGAPR